MSKAFWFGRHATRPELGSPVSKVHTAGLVLLKQLGWQQVASDTHEVPVFAFTTRKGANYSAYQANLPTIRQLPHSNTACLDDKRRMQQHLQAAGQSQLLPSCWDTLDDFLAWLAPQLPSAQSNELSLAYSQHIGSSRPQHRGASPPVDADGNPPSITDLDVAATSSDVSPVIGNATATWGGRSSSGSASLPGGTYFLKHRSGVKGQAVYPAQTTAQLQHLLHKLKSSSRDFVVQQEVPPLLLDGHKFVLRGHVVVTVPQLQVYLHEDVILIKHACDYHTHNGDVAAHVSSKGSRHPKPILLATMPTLHTHTWPQLQQLVLQAIKAVQEELKPRQIDPDSVLYHLFGFDCMVDVNGKLVLLEINSYPAIASGTMSGVDVEVFTRLLHDMLTLLVLPMTDNSQPDPGGFTLL